MRTIHHIRWSGRGRYLRVTVREIQFQKAPPIDLVTATAPNWTAVWFFATLSFLHWCICVPAFAHGRWE
jgi:hypothetical protein